MKFKKIIFVCLFIITLLLASSCGVSYTIYFDSNGGSEVASITTDGKSTVSIPNNPTKEGYEFNGWYWDNNTYNNPFTANSLLDAPLSSDMTVYAKWTEEIIPIDNYLISANNFTVDGSKLNITVPNSTSSFSFINQLIFKQNITFTVATDIEGNNIVSSKIITLLPGDNVVYILAKSNNDTVSVYNVTVRRKSLYTITFSDGIQPQTIEEDNLIIEPEEPTKAGYVFDKWLYSQADYNFDSPVTSDMNINANWISNINSLIFNGNGSTSGSMSNQNINTSATAILTANSYTKTGYTFIGWGTSSEGNVLYNNQANYTMGTESSYTLYAVWQANTNTLRFNGNGSTSGTMNKQLIDTDDTENLIPNAFIKNGYTFIGWSTTKDGAVEYTDQVNYIMGTESSYTLYAVWQANTNTLIFNGNGSTSGSMSNQSIDTNCSANLTANVFIKSGYTFLGWSNTKDGAVEYTDQVNYIMGTESSYTLYAVWQANTNSIIFDGNGSTSGSMSNQNINTDATAILTANSYTKTGYTFIGWGTSSEGNVLYNNQASYTMGTESSYTLYAVWENSTFNYTISDNEIIITGLKAQFAGDLIIPTQIEHRRNNFSVTSIGSSAFYSCRGLTGITIPDSVISIGSSAFSGCSGLTKMALPFVGASKTATNSSALFGYIFGTSSYTGGTAVEQYYLSSYNATYYIPLNLKTITINDGALDYGVFFNCSGLTSVTIGSGVTSIGSHAFSGCSGLTSITIPDSVTSIGSSAFSGCSGLKEITLPFIGNTINGTSSTYFGYIFGAGSCYNNYVPSSLKTVLITKTTNIADNAFYNCSGLTGITIPDSVTSIGFMAFYNCSGLTSVIIPDSVTSIGSSAFSSCSGLTSITIPDSVTSIGYLAFCGCSGLTGITVDNNNTVYHSNENCLIKTATEILILGCQNSIIPNDGSVTSIGSYAFSGCSGLTSITIPDSVTSIGSNAFYDCSSLTGITVDSNNTVYHSNENCLIKTATKILILGCKNSIIPNDGSVTSIGSHAFSGCSGLTGVRIPDSVTSIGIFAFYGCSGLTSVTIPDNVTSIGEFAFYDCSGLTGITIPDSVTSIGSYAFCGCRGLTGITIPGSVTSIGSGTFLGCSGLTSITIPDSVTSIGSYAFYNCNGLTSVTFVNTTGWYVTATQNSASGTTVTVTNTSANATYLKSTYYNYYWYRK